MNVYPLNTSTGTVYCTVDSDDKLTRISWQKTAGAMSSLKPPVWMNELEEYFAGIRRTFTMPLAAKGTPFQKRVWEVLLTIPYGKTYSYVDVAAKLNTHPRAIGGAVGANPIPIVIPCHRVMGKSGKLTGFSGGQGIKTKAQLLKIEGIYLV